MTYIGHISTVLCLLRTARKGVYCKDNEKILNFSILLLLSVT